MQKTVEAMLGYFTQIRQVYAGELNRRFEKEKFSPNEMSVLILLSNNRTIDTASQMRVVLGVSKGLVSRSIESLAERGLVECRQDERDRRVQRVCLTGAAAPFVRRLNEEIGRVNREVAGRYLPGGDRSDGKHNDESPAKVYRERFKCQGDGLE